MSDSQKEQNEKSDSQKYSSAFEKLCVDIVSKILGNSLNEITQTQLSKDGGYDIYSTIKYKNKQYSVLFECKLRKSKVNLRDIAANVIIAYNKCTDSLVLMTNNLFTPQLEEQLLLFRDSCQLNIKVVIGSDIENVIQSGNIPISIELAKLLKKEKPNKRTKHDSSLILNFGSKNVCQQIIEKPLAESDNKESDFMAYVYLKEFNSAISLIKNNKSFIVQGYIGTGKSAFIRKILTTVDHMCIRLNASVCQSQEQVILHLIRSIWGLPDNIFLGIFEKDDIDRIIKTISANYSLETCEFIRHILNKTSLPIKIQANCILCEYLVCVMKQHRDKTKYIVYFDNLHTANQEVNDFFVYLINLFSNSGISCIIEYDLSEYDLQKQNPEALKKIKNKYAVIDIAPLTNEQAKSWLTQQLNTTEKTADQIVKSVGTRFYNIRSISQSLKKRMTTPSFKKTMESLSMLTPNDLPAITSNIIRSCKESNESLFYLLKILNCRIPIDLLSHLKLSYGSLLEEGIIACEDSYIIASNEFVKWAVMKETSNSEKEHDIARSILKFCDQNLGKNKDARIYGLFYSGRREEAIKEIDLLINELGQKRNFMLMLEFIELAITISKKNDNAHALSCYLIKKLEVYAVIKSIAFDKARSALDELQTLLDSGQLDQSDESYSELALCYFKGNIALKGYELSDDLLNKHRLYFQNCIDGTMKDNPDDYLGKVCRNYAIYIKETEGNSAALKIFEAALNALPNSQILHIEHLSHLACISLSCEPQKSYKYYSKIIEEVNNCQTFYGFPFHEYGDKAMCKVLLKESDKAIAHSDLGIKYAESHGVFDEVGRILNIKGCAFLLAGKVSEAVKCFKEATEIMEYSGYKHYSWRGKLNYVNNSITSGNKEELRNMLCDAYSVFKSGLIEKIQSLIKSGDDFISSREYLALLVVGKCSQQLFKTKTGKKENPISAEKIADEFNFPCEIKEHYLKTIDQLINRPKQFELESLYIHNGNIFIIG